MNMSGIAQSSVWLYCDTSASWSKLVFVMNMITAL